MAHDGFFATDHQAVIALLAGDATTGADGDVVHTGRVRALGKTHVVAIIRITAVDDDVAVLHMRGAVGDGAVDDGYRSRVLNDAALSVLHQAPRHTGAYTAEADHSELHGVLPFIVVVNAAALRSHRSRGATVINERYGVAGRCCAAMDGQGRRAKAITHVERCPCLW